MSNTEAKAFLLVQKNTPSILLNTSKHHPHNRTLRLANILNVHDDIEYCEDNSGDIK